LESRAASYSDRPTLGEVKALEHELVISACNALDALRGVRERASYGPSGNPIEPKSYLRFFTERLAEHRNDLTEALRTLNGLIEQARACGLTLPTENDSEQISAGLLETAWMHVRWIGSREAPREQFLSILLLAESSRSVERYVRDFLLNEKRSYSGGVDEIEAQAQILERLSSNPQAIPGALHSRPRAVSGFFYQPPPPPNALARFMAWFNGPTEDPILEAQRFAARAREAADAVRSAFDAIEEEPGTTVPEPASATEVVPEAAPAAEPHLSPQALPASSVPLPSEQIENGEHEPSHTASPDARAGGTPARPSRTGWYIAAALLVGALGGAAGVGYVAHSRVPASPESPVAPPDAALRESAQLSAQGAAQSPASTAKAFYGALAQGDGTEAVRYVVPEKRNRGAYTAQGIASFYGNLTEPLRLLEVKENSDGSVLVHYRYQAKQRRCDGRAVITSRERNGAALIESIRPLDGC
jgi:hypothetical protein